MKLSNVVLPVLAACALLTCSGSLVHYFLGGWAVPQPLRQVFGVFRCGLLDASHLKSLHPHCAVSECC